MTPVSSRPSCSRRLPKKEVCDGLETAWVILETVTCLAIEKPRLEATSKDHPVQPFMEMGT